MNRLVKKLLVVFSTLCLTGQIEASDAVRYAYLDGWYYSYLDYRINSGKMIPQFVFQQPYEIYSQSDANEGIAKCYNDFWQAYFNDSEISLQLNIADKIHTAKTTQNRYRLDGSAHLVTENLTLANRTTVNQEYKYDPFYAGDLSESGHWLFGRVNDAYANIRWNNFNLFAGRMQRNWGAIGEKSLILSDAAYSYDHFLFSWQSRLLKFSLIFAQLENLSARTHATPDQFITARKYLAGHRLDFHFMPELQIALTEMAIYGGAGRDVEWALFNPMTFYYGVQRNDKRQLNGLWALDVFYKPLPELSLYGQFLIDDIIVNNDPGVDDRSMYPDRLGVQISIRGGDLPINGTNWNLTYIRVWNRTYQSKYTWENYHYRGLGLGYPSAGLEEIKAGFSLWNLFPFFAEQELITGRYGSVALTDLFPLEKESFPVAPVTNNFISRTTLRYFLSPSVRFFVQGDYFKNGNHYLNRINKSSGWSFEIGGEWLLSVGF